MSNPIVIEIKTKHTLTADRIYDAETADVFLQCALFGEIVFG